MSIYSQPSRDLARYSAIGDDLYLLLDIPVEHACAGIFRIRNYTSDLEAPKFVLGEIFDMDYHLLSFNKILLNCRKQVSQS